MSVMQVQDSMQQQGQPPNSPLQQPLHRQSTSSSPKQVSCQSEERSFGVSDADPAEQGSFAVLVKEAADAMHQVALVASIYRLIMYMLGCTLPGICTDAFMYTY